MGKIAWDEDGPIFLMKGIIAGTAIVAEDRFWELQRQRFKLCVGEYTNKEPITLRNPYTGRIFWMQS